jgi:ABC-type transport system involved in multi-copper enzyme maturation permease subunit
MRKLLRSKRVIGIMAIAVLASYALTSTVLSSPQPTSGDDFFRYAVMLSPILLIVAAALIGSDLLLVEFHEKTGFSLFPNPVSRKSIWFGKFLAAESIMLIVLLIYLGLFTAIAEANKHHVSTGLFLEAVPIAFMVATMMMSFALLVSSIFKGPIGATITVLFALIVSPALDGLIASRNVPAWFTPFSSVNNAFIHVLVSEDNNGVTGAILPFGLQQNMPLGVSLAVVAAYTVGGAIASILLFSRRDM